MKKLSGKRVLVTAGAQGIGLAVTKALVAAGCDVCIHFFSSAIDCEALKAECGVRSDQKICSFQADLRNRVAAEKLLEHTVAELGGLDILINNAGSLVARRLLEELDDPFYETVMDLNLASMAWVTQAAQPHLEKAGAASIVNLSSLAGRKGGHGGSLLYSTAKGAVLTWTRALASELGPKGIRVNAIAPGLILGTRFHEQHTSKASADETVRGIPLGRAGNPEDVARATLFLASEFDGFITGATLDINGGVYCA